MTTEEPEASVLHAPAPGAATRAADGGFLLLELLVAMALTALIMGTLAVSIRSARDGLAHVERSQADLQLTPTRNYLRSVFFQARPLPPGLAGTAVGLSFDGDSRSVRFVSTYVPHGQYEGVYIVEIGTNPAPGRSRGRDLVVRQIMLRPPNSDGTLPPVTQSSATLMESVADVAFSYFGALDEGATAQWTPVWRHPEKLPSLVGIEIRRAGHTAQRFEVPVYASGAAPSVCPPRVFCR